MLLETIGDLNPKDTAAMVLIVVVVGGALLVGALDIVMKAWRRTAETRERETTKRDIAAYVAEGSMTPEEGERLIAAGEGRGKKSRCS